MNVHFSSRTDEWETPVELFQELNAKYNFALDVCATRENTKCNCFLDKKLDGLKCEWWAADWPWMANGHSYIWMNPPYGRTIGKWVKKAYEQSQKHPISIVCLLPARTDTKWWHDYCIKGHIIFLKGRLKFTNPGMEKKNSAPFPSAIVVFGKAL